ncbi:hypothetical protein [Saccharothrix hoggarensis]
MADEPDPDDNVFGLRAQIEQRQAEFADGPTMAEVMSDLDLFRGEPSNAVAILAACRAEDEARHNELYRHLWRRS